jgi:hypothetical protein
VCIYALPPSGKHLLGCRVALLAKSEQKHLRFLLAQHYVILLQKYNPLLEKFRSILHSNKPENTLLFKPEINMKSFLTFYNHNQKWVFEMLITNALHYIDKKIYIFLSNFVCI